MAWVWRSRRDRPRARDERGAVAIFTALLVSTVLVGMTSFTVDIGYQRVARRDMQAVADLVAMDMARKLDGRSTTALVGTTWNTGVGTSLNSQGNVVGAPLTVRSCTEAEVHAVDAALSATGICAFPGILNADGTFSASGSAAATHVKVLTRTSVSYFLPVFASSGSAARSAVASSQKTACFKLGSFAARINTSSSVLAPLLNRALGVNLSVLSYQGLAAGNVRLLDLATQLGLGTVDELATAKVTLGALVNATAAILTRQSGDPDAAASLSALQLLNAAAGLSTQVDLGRLFALTDSSAAAKVATVNVLDLVSGAAFIANGSNALAIPLDLGIPGLTNVTANVTVIQPPQLACGAVGRAKAKTAQVTVTVNGTFTSSVLALVTTSVGINLNLTLASATGTLTDAICGAGTTTSPYGIDVSVATALATLGLTVSSTTRLLNLLTLDVTTGAQLNRSMAASTEVAQVRVPPLDYNTPKSTGSGSIGLSGTTASASSDALPLLGSTVAAVTSSVVNPVVSALDTQLISPLTKALGINVAGADVYIAPPKPNCTSPVLRG